MAISFDKPPSGFGTGEQYTNCLRVYALNDTFYIYDSRGFLCSLQDPDALGALIRHEAERPGSVPNHPLRPTGARAFLFPAWADDREAYHASIGASVDSAREALKGQRPAAKPVTKLSLEDLGL